MIFYPIKGYEGLYSISKEGIVRSEQKMKGRTYDNFVPQKELKQKITNTGRASVGLLIGGKKTYYFVHRLVAIQFIPNLENKPQINHIDGNPLNNKVENLEWCTAKENCQHAVRTGLTKGVKGKDRWQSKPILKINLQGKLVKKYESISLACLEGGYSKGNVIKCCKGVAETAYGFKWEYAYA